MFNRVLVVCVGNICRSPLAQFVLEEMLPDLNVSSAGLAAVVNHDVHEMTRSVALQHGMVLPRHAAAQITPERCKAAQLILVMERGHRLAISRVAPEAIGKIFLFSEPADGLDIEDPYGCGRPVFEAVHQRIVQSARGWAKRLGK